MGDGQHEKVNVLGKSMGYSSYESIHENSVFFPRSVECTKRNVRHRINCANIFSEISTDIEFISAFDSITYKRFNL